MAIDCSGLKKMSTVKKFIFYFRFIKSEQDTHRDYELVSRLIRETRFEKHLAAHMISVRKEKNIMIENREQLNRQFEEVS